MSKKVDKKAQAAEFYDGYHAASDEMGPEHPVRRKTHAIYRAWLRRLAPAPGSRVLDLSCGLGHFLSAARGHDASLKLTGLDHSAYAVKRAAGLVPQAKVLRGDAMRTGLKAGSFDLITCLGSLEHYPDPAAGLREIHRLLEDRGRAFVYVPNLFFLGYIYFVWKTGEEPHEAGQNEYELLLTRQGWERLIDEAGFRVASVSKHNEMFATQRVPGLVKALYAWFIEPFVPLNLSYCFGFTLEKKPAAPGPKRKG